MIRRAIELGVTPERLAKALSVDPRTIERKAVLLEGICPEAAELLKDHQFPTDLSRVLRKMKPTRQLECVELMISANTITINYAEALLVATPSSMLVEGKKPKKLSGLTAEQIAKMEREMSNLQERYKMVEQTYGQDVLNLVLAKGYLAKLLENPAIKRILQQMQPEFLAEFEAIVKQYHWTNDELYSQIKLTLFKALTPPPFIHHNPPAELTAWLFWHLQQSTTGTAHKSPRIAVVNLQCIFGQLQGVMQDVGGCRAFAEKLFDDQ